MTIINDILGLKPSEIEKVNSYTQENTLFIEVRLSRKLHSCPHCDTSTDKIYSYIKKKIRHSSLKGKPCIILYEARRYKCPTCSSTFYENNPFVVPRSKISKLTTINILKDLKYANTTFSSVARDNFISATKVQQIFDQYVEIPRYELPPILCIDEVYALKSKRSKYLCVFLDFQTNKVIDVLAERRKDYLAHYFTVISKEERDKVVYVSIDMYTVYRDICKLYLKNAKVCVDSFHVIKNISKALNNVRIRIMKKQNKKSENYYLLKKFHWLLLKNEDDIEENEPKKNRRLNRYINYPQLLELVLKIDPELKKAHSLKEDYVRFNRYYDVSCAKQGLDEYIDNLHKNILTEFIEIRRLLNNWYFEIINSFLIIGNRRISNGPMESRNSRIKLIKRNANGYYNFERFRNRIMYVLNKDTYFNLAAQYKSKKSNCESRGKYRSK